MANPRSDTSGPFGLPILDGRNSPQNIALISYVLGTTASATFLLAPTALTPLASIPFLCALEYISRSILLDATGLNAFYFPKQNAPVATGLILLSVAETFTYASIFGTKTTFIAYAVHRLAIGLVFVAQMFRLIVVVGGASKYHQDARKIAEESQQYWPHWKDAQSVSIFWWILSVQIAMICPASASATIAMRNQLRGSGPDLLEWPESARKNRRPSYTTPPIIQRIVFGLPILDRRHSQQNISMYAFSLGLVGGIGLFFGFATQLWSGLGFFLCMVTLFHTFEYITTAMYKSSVNLSSFLINHSHEYHLAMIGGIVEYLFELYFWPSWKQFTIINKIGLVVAIAAQILRTTAMVTAGTNFSHVIVEHHDPQHRLVTNGIYAIFRHPSYTGFFYWALSLQLVMGNPFMFVAFIPGLYRFFSSRIAFEEETLIEFFGDAYRTYRTKTHTFIPFIN